MCFAVRDSPRWVRDVPPDITALLALGVGLAQSGLLPVVEVPHAKYIEWALDIASEEALLPTVSSAATNVYCGSISEP